MHEGELVNLHALTLPWFKTKRPRFDYKKFGIYFKFIIEVCLLIHLFENQSICFSKSSCLVIFNYLFHFIFFIGLFLDQMEIESVTFERRFHSSTLLKFIFWSISVLLLLCVFLFGIWYIFSPILRENTFVRSNSSIQLHVNLNISIEFNISHIQHNFLNLTQSETCNKTITPRVIWNPI